MVGAAAGLVGDTAVIMAWVAYGAFTEAVNERAVAEDRNVMVTEAISEVTIAKVVVAVAKVAIDGVVKYRSNYGQCGPRFVPTLQGLNPWREEGAKKKSTVKVEASPEKISVQSKELSSLSRALKPSIREEKTE